MTISTAVLSGVFCNTWESQNPVIAPRAVSKAPTPRTIATILPGIPVIKACIDMSMP
jgi:hypothetical protein